MDSEEKAIIQGISIIFSKFAIIWWIASLVGKAGGLFSATFAIVFGILLLCLVDLWMKALEGVE